MHILGLCNGSLHGNNDILLKVALTHAQQLDQSVTVSWLHIPSLRIPANPAPLESSMDISLGTNKSQMRGAATKEEQLDDRQAALNAILDADAIIISSATYSHQPPGFLKVLMDRIGGPYLDAGFARRCLEKKAAGDPTFANFECDPRLLKPRILGFMMTCGSTTRDQYNMALPSLHLLYYCIHAKLVDQFIATNCMDAGSVLLRPEIIERTQKVAERVVSQLGKSFDEAQYLGDHEEGACPYCHLRTVEFLPEEFMGPNGIGCMTCGARGKLAVRGDGKILPEFEEDSVWCCLTLRGKMKHADDILSWGSRERGKMDGVRAEKEKWDSVHLPMVEVPSSTYSLANGS